MKGGPGYTKFGHGRPDIKISGISYLWYSFLFAGFGFLLFFDMENLNMNHNEPNEKMQAVRLTLGRDSVPKAKEIKTQEDELIIKHDENDSDNDGDQLKDNKNKKSKVSFRNRKVCFFLNS